MRKQIVVALCIGLLLLLIPLVAGAEIVDSGTCGDNLTWTIDDQEILTISGVGEMIDFPSSSRKEWRSSPFPFNHVVINEGVTRIGVEAFACCTSIKSVSFPDSLLSIGYGAFNLTPLSSVIIPESVESIEGEAFSDTNLKDISLPANTKTGPRVFKNCYGLADANGFVILNNTLYDYCGNEYNITIPDGVTKISCLYNGYVRQVNIPDSVTRIEESAFASCPNLVSVIIPQSVVYIGSGAFEGCYNLTNAVIPDSVSYLGDDIFAGCYNLCDADGFVIANNTLYAYYGIGGKVFIPDGVTCIGKEAFYDSYNCITGIVIPETVTKIGDRAFSGTDITTVNIPAGVTEIGVSVFSSCSNLFSISVSPENSSFIVANGALFDKSMKRLIAFPPCFSSQFEFDIPETVQTIDEMAFLGCFGLTKITMPDSVTLIGRSAFEACNSLANVVIPGSIKNIPNYCFSRCTGLTDVTIMEGVTSIGEYAFNSCSGLSNVVFPTNLEEIGSYAFQYCSGLSGIDLPHTVAYLGDRAFQNCSNLKDLIIPSSMKVIGPNAFDNCKKLENISMSDGVKVIGSRAFGECKNLICISVPESVISIGYSAFENCSLLEDVTIHNSDTKIESAAFSRCASGLVLRGHPDSTTQAYAQSNKITFIAIAAEMGEPDFVFPADLNTIESEAFAGVSATIIYIPDSVTSLGSKAFADCTELTQIRIPESVVQIPDDVFEGIDLAQITIFGTPGSATELFASSAGIQFEIE